uniref:Uncharacterized protein n=8 Tax=Avena sativa TaxID=4498 RepID=A0ACD5ZAB2_AVESA
MDHRSSIITPGDLERILCDGTADPKALPLSLLEKITDGFSDEHQIGSGGFAVVYKGKLETRTVAVKRMSDAYMDEKVFHREVECLMMIKHKNIIRFVGYCANTQGSMERYDKKFVMADVHQRLLCFEYLPKGSLDKYITDISRGLQWRYRYQIITGICQGLHYLHQKKIVHLDLKPANILLDDYLVPKITDFGLSRCFGEMQSRVVTKIAGTFGYLAPESFNNTEVTYRNSYRLDIYSLGVVIIEILTGEKGYHDVDNVVESWSNMLEKSQSDVQLKQVRVCAEIGIQCIDSNPAKRPDTQHIINILNEYVDTSVINSHQVEDASTSNLPTVLEELRFSSSQEEEILPSIDGLRITGEVFPGREIHASGYSINGTTVCNFMWVRHLEDGSVNYVEGAHNPTYLVTADDVDSLLAIEVQPLDPLRRKGEIVKVYANEQRLITPDPEMKELIKKILSIGHVSYETLLRERFTDMWEPAVLAIKREGYSIKCNGQRGVVITEKFQQATDINIPYGYGNRTEFSIQSADGVESYTLKPADNSPSRDSIVLILRLFRMKAVEKSKRRNKGIFFK